jgi:hypothetical protein
MGGIDYELEWTEKLSRWKIADDIKLMNSEKNKQKQLHHIISLFSGLYGKLKQTSMRSANLEPCNMGR